MPVQRTASKLSAQGLLASHSWVPALIKAHLRALGDDKSVVDAIVARILPRLEWQHETMHTGWGDMEVGIDTSYAQMTRGELLAKLARVACVPCRSCERRQLAQPFPDPIPDRITKDLQRLVTLATYGFIIINLLCF
jgi:hypothetical protein